VEHRQPSDGLRIITHRQEERCLRMTIERVPPGVEHAPGIGLELRDPLL
jgi:hypothetical protein